MSRLRRFFIGMLGGATLIAVAKGVLLIAWMLTYNAQLSSSVPEIPIYPGATQVHSSTRSAFSDHSADLRHVTFFTTASPEELMAFYRKAFEDRGYWYNDCCNLAYGSGKAG